MLLSCSCLTLSFFQTQSVSTVQMRMKLTRTDGPKIVLHSADLGLFCSHATVSVAMLSGHSTAACPGRRLRQRDAAAPAAVAAPLRPPRSRRSCHAPPLAALTKDGPSLAIVGTTGAVGQEFLSARAFRSRRSRRAAGSPHPPFRR